MSLLCVYFRPRDAFTKTGGGQYQQSINLQRLKHVKMSFQYFSNRRRVSESSLRTPAAFVLNLI